MRAHRWEKELHAHTLILTAGTARAAQTWNKCTQVGRERTRVAVKYSHTQGMHILTSDLGAGLGAEVAGVEAHVAETLHNDILALEAGLHSGGCGVDFSGKPTVRMQFARE